MNISKTEQRVLHALAQGGAIRYERAPNGRVTAAFCFTRDGLVLADFTLTAFRQLLKRGFIRSRNSAPYRITAEGLRAVRAQLDNR